MAGVAASILRKRPSGLVKRSAISGGSAPGAWFTDFSSEWDFLEVEPLSRE
jgi:hypothetical protein